MTDGADKRRRGGAAGKNGGGKAKPETKLPVPAGKKKVTAVEKRRPAAPVPEPAARYDLLRQYFAEIRKYPLLDREEEHRLAVEFSKTKDTGLAFRLVTANLRLVVKIAMEYASAAANLLDLIQEGNVGLMQAVKKYDPFKGTRLSSYAQWWIRAYILKYLVSNVRMVKIGTTQAQRKLFFNLRREKERLESRGFKPEPALLAAALDVRESEVEEMDQRLRSSDLSLDAPIGEDGRGKVLDLFAAEQDSAEDALINKEIREILAGHIEVFVKDLGEREMVIWRERIMAHDPKTLQEIGDRFGVTRERMRQIEKGVRQRLKKFIRERMPELAEESEE